MARSPRSHIDPLEPRMLLAAATINWNDVHQSIDGFGVSTAWSWNTIPSPAVDEAFSPTTGAGLSLLRTRMGPSGWSSEEWIMQQMVGYGVRVWSTPWSPPREWKTNHDSYNGGNLDPAHYQDYANLLANYVQDMSRQGVQLYAISLQNEPNWTATYESCNWSAQQFADFLPYVGQTFASRGITTKIMLPEGTDWEFSLASIVMANPSLAQYVGILAAHHYDAPAPYTPVTIANGKTIWETEVTLSSGYSPISNAVVVADDIHQAMTIANVNAYHYWWFNTSDAGGLFDMNYNPTKRLWAMGQYSRFVRPGWVRIGETDDGGLDITTFKDPVSGKFAIVVVNANDSGSINETFTLNGVSAGSVTPYVTSATDDMAQYAAIALSGGTTFSAGIAGNSIVTFYGIDAAAPAVQAPGNMAAAPAGAPGEDATSQISVTWTDNSSGESAYTVERSLDGSTWTVLTTSLPANTTSYVDTGLSENTLYYYRVKPSNGAANTYGTVVSTRTILKAPFYWWSLGGSRIDGGWGLWWPIDSPVATGASLDRSLDGLAWTNIATFDTRVTWYADNIPNFDPNQIYFYRVRVSAGNTYSAYAPWNTGLAAPMDFAASRIRAQSITFTWTNPTHGASGAWIEEQDSNGNWNTVSPSNLQATDGTWTIGGLSAQTTYKFRLKTTAEADTVSSPYTTELDVTTIAPTVGPVVWYRADEGSGTTLGDASGNGDDATLVGSAGFGPEVYGDALSLSGGYASLPTGVVAGLSDFTIATWVKPSSLDSWSRIFDFGTGMSNYMFLTPNAGGSGLPGFWINTPTGGTQVNSNVALTAGKWEHIAVTLSGNTITLYINGVVAGSGWTGTYPINLGTTTQNYLGKSQYPWDPAFQGSLDDFRIYDHALSAGEIAALTQVPAPASVSFQVNNGSAQRSMVSSLTLTFDKPVTLANDAVALTLRGGTFPGGIVVTPSADLMSYTLTFTGVGASLADGTYVLTLKAASVTDSLGQTLTGGDRRYRFFRLFGDANGDRMVNRTDLVLFRAALSQPAVYVSYFDYDNNGTVSLLDYAQFRRRMVRRLI